MGERRYILAFFLLLYAISSAGDIQGDSKVRWIVATQIAETGWFDLPPNATTLSVFAPDGREYSFFGLGQSIVFVPCYVIGELVAVLPLPASVTGDLIGQFLASIVVLPLFGAIGVVLLFMIALEIGAERRTARWVAVLYGIATMHWHSSINTYEATQIEVCLLLCVWCVLRSWKTPGLRYPLIAMTAGGVAMMFRPPSVAFTAPVLLTGIIGGVIGNDAWKPRLGRWVIAGCVGVLPFLALHLMINQARFGGPFMTGYAEGVGIWTVNEFGERVERIEAYSLWSTPLLEGLGGLLVSPGKSVFLYNPILLVAIPGLIGLWRIHRRLTIAILAATAAALALHAKYLYWSGDQAWGPRYLAEAMGLVMLGLVPVLAWRPGRWLLIPVAAVSVAVQIAGNVYSFGTEFAQQPGHDVIPDEYVWRPDESHFALRFRNIAMHATGGEVPEFKRREDKQFSGASGGDGEKKATNRLVVNVFPFKAMAFVKSRTIHLALLAVWLLGLVMLPLVAWRWRSAVGRARLAARLEPPDAPEGAAV